MKIVIIGGVAAGPKTGAVLARRMPEAEIILFQQEKLISYGSCGMPYFASGDIPSFTELNNTGYGIPRNTEFFDQTKGFKVKTECRVIAIDRSDKSVRVKNLQTGEEFDENYDKLVIATGANPARAPFEIPESDRVMPFTRPDDAINFRRMAEQGKIGKAVIVGGGFIGCELTEACGGLWGIETLLIEKEPQLLPYILDPEMSEIAERELKRQNIELRLGTTVDKITLNDEKLPVVRIGEDEITADYVFLCLGVKPETTLAEQAGLELGEFGAIKVDKRLTTSDPDIYAGGDCVESFNLISKKPIYMPMGSLANRHGRVIAENIAGRKTEFAGVAGAFLVKLFDMNVGTVGLSEKAARSKNIESESVWGSFPDKPDYYPEAKTMSLKLVYEKTSNRLLGLQAVGTGDICRRIDVMSALLHEGKTLEDIHDFEQGYAPPYSEALDPLHHLAGLAEAAQKGIGVISPNADREQEVQWLDVREQDEIGNMPWNSGNGVHSIPLGELRQRLNELDRDKPVIIFCRRGPRSYQAAVILKQAGFKSVSLVGGGTQAAIS